MASRPAQQRSRVARRIASTMSDGVTVLGHASESAHVVQGDTSKPSTHSRFIFFLSAICAVEGADAMLLPTSFHALERDLQMTPTSLASMSLAQALMSALAAPLWGILADRGVMTRRAILVLGCCGWGIVTLLLAGTSSLWVMLVLRAVNGSMLACLGPVTQGVVADVTAPGQRGQVIGFLGLATNAGSMLLALVATPVSTQMVFGLYGWRVAFTVIGLMSLAVGWVVLQQMEEPERDAWMGAEASQQCEVESVGSPSKAAVSFRAAAGAEARRLWGYFQNPTFLVIVAQGVFGSIPWNALGFMTMYFQLAGLNDVEASLTVAAFQLACAFGSYLGGWVGDCLTRSCPDHGRPFTAQISVISGIPCVIVLFGVIPPGSESVYALAFVSVILGLTATWCGAGVNRPVLSEIVDTEGRSVILAWCSALEGSSAALFGAPAVGYMAEKFFGYKLSQGQSPVADNQNATALGKALVGVMTGPWLLCLLFFCFLHWSYARDRDLALQRRQQKSSPSRPNTDLELAPLTSTTSSSAMA